MASRTASGVAMDLGPEEQQIMAFLHEHVFDPVLASPTASNRLKQGCRLTITRMSQLNAAGMTHYFWSAIVGTAKSTSFAAQLEREGFNRFEETIPMFRDRFEKPRVIRPSR